jgi:hypothetical protein
MGDMRETKSEIVEAHRVLERIPSNQGLMKVNKLLLTVVFALMTLVLILGFMVFPGEDFISTYKKVTPLEIHTAGVNPVLSAEVNTLKGQVVGLVSGSIESKLRALENSIKLGSVSNSLGTIEDLKNDIKVLRSYSDPVESKSESAVLKNEQLMQEMSHLKDLIYFTLASCGLMFAAVAGIWIKQRYLPLNKESRKAFLDKK